MNLLRPTACLLAVMLVFSLSGCKLPSGLVKAVKKEVAGEVVEQGIRAAAGAVTGSKQGASSGSAVPSAGRGSGLARAGGAMVAGGAVAAGTAAISEASGQNRSTQEAVNTLVGYYQNLAAGRTSAAYNTLTWEMQNQLGTYESFSQGYTTTVSNEVSNIRIVSETPAQVVVSYQLDSKDKINGRISQQSFSGRATLLQSDGRWLIGEFDVTLR